MSVTDLEIDDAIREAWTILYAGSAASPSAHRLATALLAVTTGTPAHPHWVPPMTCGATGWLFSPTREPGWRPGVRGRASRTAGCPLPFCRKAKRDARTLICYGAQPCGAAPISPLRAGPSLSRKPGAGIIPNDPALPAQGRGGANHPHPGSNPVVARSEWP